MSLVAAECERQGIATVTIQLLREVAEKVRPPRALFVPFKHGYPLDKPGQPEKQIAVLESALELFEDQSLEKPVLVDFKPINK